MNSKFVGAALGLAVLAASSAASAHVDLAVGLDIPATVFAPAPVYAEGPVTYAPAVAPVLYPGDDDWREREWRAREWRERREWREHEWRREQWREHEWREQNRWRGY